MTVLDLFSKRQKRNRGEVPDVYSYDKLPNFLRVQIIQIWTDALGSVDEYMYRQDKVKQAYESIDKALCREYGVFRLPGANEYENKNSCVEVANFFLQEQDVEKALDVVELCFRVIDRATRDWRYLGRPDPDIWADAAIDELNTRFKEGGVGYSFSSGEIIRVDSQFLHAEAVKPTLMLLNGSEYTGAQEEFLGAYEHYRHGKNKEALNDCLKALESTMKAICGKRRWSCPDNATAKTLIQICFDNHLVPAFWQSQMASLRSLLESSVPTGRNQLSGHGQGSDPIAVPDHIVSYMLHMTASTIVFLVNAEQSLV